MRPFTSCSQTLLSLWLQSEEVCCYEGSEECRTLHRDSGGWDQTPEICKCVYISQTVNDLCCWRKHSTSWFHFVYIHMKCRGSHKSRECVFAHTYCRVKALTQNQPNCLFSKSRIWTLYLLINSTRNWWSSPPGIPVCTCKFCRLYSGIDQWKNLYFVLNFSMKLLLENALPFWQVCIIILPNTIDITYSLNSPWQYTPY